ncbi:MAG: sigma-70 family RNA polymerase sigma factor [Muribaculaceae bacterium]|nr:sigma-70 family RNA polymerase sigma factor [Muribaculaceae bacterium]
MKAENFPQEAKRLRPVLVSVAFGIVGDHDEAEDIAQDVLLKLWTLCPQLRSPIDALASVATRNIARSHLRRRHPSCNIDETELSESDEKTEIDASFDRIISCIDALPPFQQLAIRLRHMEGLEYSKIADITGSSESAIRKVVSRARIAIRNQYWEEEKNERKKDCRVD